MPDFRSILAALAGGGGGLVDRLDKRDLLKQQAQRQASQDALAKLVAEAQIGRLNAPPPAPTPQRIYDPKRGGIVDELAGTFTGIPNLPALVEEPKEPTPQQHIVDPTTGKVTFFDPRNPPKDLKVTPRPRLERSSGGMTNANMLSLRGQFNNEQTVKNAAEIATALRKVRASGNDPSPAGDISLLVGYMKLLDPGSVVREQEFATAAKAGSLPQQIQAAGLKVANGQRLTPEQRADFIKKAEDVARGYGDQLGLVRTRYQKDAEAAGLDPSRIAYDPFEGLFTPASKITPQERAALKARGFTDAQINAKYGTP